MTGRSAIVTGAAQGIGRAIGEALLDEGGDVCFADLNGEKAAEVAAANERRAADNGAMVMGATVDVTQRDQVREMIAKAVETFGKLDVKFNNAGVKKLNYGKEEVNKLFEEIKELFLSDGSYAILEKNLLRGLQRLLK